MPFFDGLSKIRKKKKVEEEEEEEEEEFCHQPEELGSIHYVNLSPDGRHGDYAKALEVAAEGDSEEIQKPIFANFVEWSGWSGCKDAGRGIFANKAIVHAAETLFVPCAFNTWDRYNSKYNEAMKCWSSGLEDSWWGYLRIIDPKDTRRVISATRQITGRHQLAEVKHVMRLALEDLGIPVPESLK